MLVEMLIRNFVLIDELRLEFDSGLNVLTGETGAGKSILIDALGLITGDRIRDDYLRDSRHKALVETTFTLQGRPEAQAFLQGQGLNEDGEDTVTVSREIAPNGRSTARINGRSVPVSTLRDLSGYLLDLHVQGEQHRFLQPETYLHMVDAFAPEIYPVRSKILELYQSMQQLRQRLQELAAAEESKAQRLDFLDFQISEIEKARLIPGEDEELLALRQRIRNAHRLAETSQKMLMDLYQNEEGSSAYDRLSSALNAASCVNEDPFFASLMQPLQEMTITLQDLAAGISSFQDELDFEPGRLEHIEERLHTIERLKSKYGAGIQEILSYLADIADQRDQLRASGEQKKNVEEELRLMEHGYQALADQLSSLRRGTAGVLQTGILNELNGLNMPHIRLTVQVEPRSTPGPLGIDRVEFWFSANPGEELRPLARTASGGELSRVILAIKTTLADTYQVPTLIFDEIDVGVGGTSLTAMARKLKKLSGSHQVILVTHAPQVAAYADVHYYIHKEMNTDQTLTRVIPLQGEDRVLELARMLSGESISEITLQHAREMLDKASGV